MGQLEKSCLMPRGDLSEVNTADPSQANRNQGKIHEAYICGTAGTYVQDVPVTICSQLIRSTAASFDGSESSGICGLCDSCHIVKRESTLHIVAGRMTIT